MSAPLPRFVEAFVDDGCTDGYRVMRALRAVEYRGGVTPEHTPEMAGDRRVGQAFTLGHMKAMLQRADEEAGVPATAPRAQPEREHRRCTHRHRPSGCARGGSSSSTTP